jgi:hypothetical protein
MTAKPSRASTTTVSTGEPVQLTDSPLTEGTEGRTNDGASLDYTAAFSNTMISTCAQTSAGLFQQRQPGAPFEPASLGFSSVALSAMNGYDYLPRFDIRTFDALRPVRSILGSNRSDITTPD